MQGKAIAESTLGLLQTNFVDNLVFCKNAVSQIFGEAIHGDQLTFYHLGSFSMNFSHEKDNDHFSDMSSRFIYVEGIMSDIFLPRKRPLYRVVISKVQSLTNSELLQMDALSESIKYEEIIIEESIHVTLPKIFMNGQPVSNTNPPAPFDFTLDPWNVQQKVFVEARVPYIKSFNGLPLNDAQRKALVTDDTGKNCALFCQCGQKSKGSCISCSDKHKKNCAICIKNKIKLDNEDIYKQICSIKNMTIVNGPAQIYSTSTASNLLKYTKTDEKTWQTIQSTCSDAYVLKNTEVSIGRKIYFYSTILIVVFAARSNFQ